MGVKFSPKLVCLDDRIVPSVTPEYLLDGIPVPAEAVQYDTPTLADAGLAPYSQSTGTSQATAADAANPFLADPPPPPPAFDKIDDVITNLNKNKAAADILAAFQKAGGTVESGTTDTGGYIQFPAKPGDNYKIVIDPNASKVKDLSDATGVLLFELLRYQNQADQSKLDAQVKNKTITPDQYADQSEALTYTYVQKQQEIAQAAVKAKDWTLTTDRYAAILTKFPKLDDFMTFEKTPIPGSTQSHWDLLKARGTQIAGSK